MLLTPEALSDTFFVHYPHPALLVQSGQIVNINKAGLSQLTPGLMGSRAAKFLGMPDFPLHLAHLSSVGPLPEVEVAGRPYCVSAHGYESSILLLLSPIFDEREKWLSRIMQNVYTSVCTQSGTLMQRHEALRRTFFKAVKEDAEEKRLWAMAEQAHYNLLRFSANLRECSRFLRGEEVANYRPVEAAGLCHRVARCTNRALLYTKKVLRLDLPQEPVWICADSDLLERLLYNLVTNSLRHSGVLEARLALYEKNGSLCLSVSDKGCGLSPECLRSLEQPLFQDYTPETAFFSGLSLGLRICRSIAEAHGGALLISSSKEGLEVSVTLPLGMEDESSLCEVRSDYTGGYPHHLVELSALEVDYTVYLE